MTATLAVIPARWSSSRFPGKVLAPLAGRPVILHVLDRVSRARQVDACLVATDDERIAEVVRDSGHEAVMTRPDHPSGSDRIAEAITGRPAPIILNVQGDEPLVDPAALDQLVLALKESDAMAATLAVAGSGDIEDRNVVKVVCDAAGYALYFSRAPIPASHPGRDGDSAWLRHVGVYAWRRPAFEDFVARAVSRLEQHEGLEQLRFLEHGGRMHVEIATSVAPGVDTPEDLARCEALLARSGRQV
ncbi:3-deoxy-manno-octulosonate cytidylyltransferase [bacterium]|nr:MAG: 3-deoxy-manno-octulosonate cytidylyltransferase [bacterium]